MNNKKHGEQVRQKILDYIIEFIKEHGYPPSRREICDGIGLKSTSSVQSHMERMIDQGIIEVDADYSPRAIRVPGYKFVRDNDGKDT